MFSPVSLSFDAMHYGLHTVIGYAGDRVGTGRVLHVGQVEKPDAEEIYGSSGSLVTSPLNTNKFECTYWP
jgi:hypothetical protein